jgi:RecA-family ATPase
MAKIKNLEELQKFIVQNKQSNAATFERYAEDGKKLAPLRQLFGNYIVEGALIHFPARRGCGKSLFCLQLCLAITHRYDHFLGEAIKKHGSTLYLDFEMSEQVTQRRAYQLKKNAPVYSAKFADEVIIYNSRKSFVEDFDTIMQAISQTSPVLVVIDNLRNALHNVNTNSATEMANFFSILSALKEIYGFAIIIVDHFKKHTNNLRTDSDLQSGSGVKTDLSDGDFILRNSCQNKNWRLLKRIKSRLTEESDTTKLISFNPQTLWFELVKEDVNEAEHIGLGEIQDKEELKDIAIDMYEKGSTLEEIARTIHKSKSTVHRYITEKKPDG